MKNNKHIIWLEQTESTNNYAITHKNDIDKMSVTAALEQTAGRGQGTNRWLSAPGQNLTFTITLKYPLPDNLTADDSLANDNDEVNSASDKDTTSINTLTYNLTPNDSLANDNDEVNSASDKDTTSINTLTNIEEITIPRIKAENQFVISQITALAVIDLLQKHKLTATIKWPNDIYVGNRKICGILISHTLRGKNLADSIIGIGININQTQFDPSIPNPTSLILELDKKIQNSNSFTPANTIANTPESTPANTLTNTLANPPENTIENSIGNTLERPVKHFELKELLEEFIDGFTKRLEHLSQLSKASDNTIRNNYEEINKAYHDHMYKKGEQQEFINTNTNTHFIATILGVAPNGCLQLKHLDNTTHTYAFKEISYVIKNN